MTFQVIHPPHPTPAQSPYRIVQHETKREVVWANRFLDRECIRCLAETTLRSYALDLLRFLRWWVSVHRTDIVTEKALTESTLLEYVRFQAGQSPRPAAATINRRVVVADHALKSEFPNAPCRDA
jgi:site-specific recombinase XerD